MGARQKLNVAYFQGSLIVAAVIGLATQAWEMFVIALAVLIGANLHAGAIRPSPGEMLFPPPRKPGFPKRRH